MKFHYSILVVLLSLFVHVQTVAAYETKNGYFVSSETAYIVPGADGELILQLTNPTEMRPVFQFDVTLPAGIDPVADDGQNYCVATNGCTIKSSYSASRRRLRILVTGGVWAAGEAQPFAKLNLHAAGTFSQTKSITVNNMVFMMPDSETGFSGKSTTVSASPLYPVTSLSFAANSLFMYAGESKTITPVIQPGNASVKALDWKSSNTSVATVTQDGVVTANAVGTATITATTTDGTNLSATCLVNVMRDCFITADTVKYVRGTANTTVELAIALNNRIQISGLQFDITLPSNATMNMVNNYPDVWLSSARKTRTHSLEVERQSTNKYRVLVSSSNSSALKDTQGELVYLHLTVPQYGTAGLYNFSYSNVYMSTPEEVQYTQNSWSSPLSYEYMVGDANADLMVDVADYVVTANQILGRQTGRYFSDAANVNNDNIVNVTDLVGITNIALGKRPTTTRRIKPTQNAQDIKHNEPVLTANCENGMLTLALENATDVAGLQLDIELPQGMTIGDAQLLGRASGHDLQTVTMADGRVRLLMAAFNDHDIAAGSGNIAALTLHGASGGTATLKDIVIAERDLTSHEPADLAIATDMSGVSTVNSANRVRIYAEQGKLVIESAEAGKAQMIYLNGMTRTLDVKPGLNTYPVEQGFYIVRMDNTSVKLRIK